MLPSEILRIWSCTILMMSPGTTPPSVRDHPVDEVLEREEAREGDPDQDRGEEREEEVVGELRGEPEAVVRHELLDGPGEQAPTSRAAGS